MIDAPTIWLLQQLQKNSTTQSLWLSDENVLHQLPDIQHWNNKPKFISNRWDLAEKAKQCGLDAQFNDFDMSAIADNSVDQIFYRISKEKAVSHHLINQAHRVLQPKGILWICGQKNEGIKTYIEKASVLFGCEKSIQKDGTSYSSQLVKYPTAGVLLNDENYPELRDCLDENRYKN